MDGENKFLLDLPQTDEPKEEKPRENCLAEILREQMDKRKLKDVDMVKIAKVPWSTWSGWITEEVRSPLLDGNLKRTWMALETVPLEHLCFGVGEDRYKYDFSKAKGWDGFQEKIRMIRKKRNT